MKKVILFILAIFLFQSSAFSFESSLYGSQNSNNSNATINLNMWSKIDDTYYNNNPRNPTSYRREGDKIYGSDGSSYTIFGNTIQNNSTGKTYQINNNLIRPLY